MKEKTLELEGFPPHWVREGAFRGSARMRFFCRSAFFVGSFRGHTNLGCDVDLDSNEQDTSVGVTLEKAFGMARQSSLFSRALRGTVESLPFPHGVLSLRERRIAKSSVS